MSLHFRGPLALKQFAVYTPGTGSSKKRSVRQTSHDRRHGHQQFHGHNKEVREAEDHADEVKRGIGSLVTATEANGAVVTFTNQYGAAATTKPTTTSTATVVAIASSIASSSSAAAASEQMGSVTPVAASSISSSSAATASGYASSDSWARQAYYSSDHGTADGLVFLNNMGGGGSGVFDMYANLLMVFSFRAIPCADGWIGTLSELRSHMPLVTPPARPHLRKC